MLKKIKKTAYLYLTFIFFFVLFPCLTFAQYTHKYGLADTKKVNTTQDSLPAVIGEIVKFLLTFVGGLSVLMIVIAGIMYIVSGGDEGKVDTAKKWITYAIVGLVVSLLGWVIVNTVIKAL